MTSFHNPEISSRPNDELTTKQNVFASIVWNFIEAVHNLKLNDDKYL